MIRPLLKLLLRRLVPPVYRDLDAQRLAVDEAIAEHYASASWGYKPWFDETTRTAS